MKLLGNLTPRELSIVDLLLVGTYKYKDCANELGITEQQVKNHMISVFRKTGTETALHLCVMVMREQMARQKREFDRVIDDMQKSQGQPGSLMRANELRYWAERRVAELEKKLAER